MGVVVDVHTRIRRPAGHHEVDELGQRPALLLAVVGPERLEHGLAGIEVVEAEQVLEAALLHGIPFHVEKEIPIVRLGKAGKPPERSRFDREQLDDLISRLAFKYLQTGLLPELPKRIGSDFRHGLGGRKRPKRSHGADSGRFEPGDLLARDARDGRQVVVVDPPGGTTFPPGAQATVLARGRVRHLRRVRIGRDIVEQPGQERAVIVEIVADPEALPPPVPQFDVHVVGQFAGNVRQQVGIETELE